MDYFDFLNLFGFGRISQIYIIFLDIYVKQICGIWCRLFEFNISAFFIFAGADSDCCINSACSRSSMTVCFVLFCKFILPGCGVLDQI